MVAWGEEEAFDGDGGENNDSLQRKGAKKKEAKEERKKKQITATVKLDFFLPQELWKKNGAREEKVRWGASPAGVSVFSWLRAPAATAAVAAAVAAAAAAVGGAASSLPPLSSSPSPSPPVDPCPDGGVYAGRPLPSLVEVFNSLPARPSEPPRREVEGRGEAEAEGGEEGAGAAPAHPNLLTLPPSSSEESPPWSRIPDPSPRPPAPAALCATPAPRAFPA